MRSPVRFAGDQTFARASRKNPIAGIERLLDARPGRVSAILLDWRNADDERLAARGAGTPQPLRDRLDRGAVVAAFEVEKYEVVEWVHRQLLAAVAGVHRRARTLSARTSILVRRIDAEGGLAAHPEIDDGRAWALPREPGGREKNGNRECHPAHL